MGIATVRIRHARTIVFVAALLACAAILWLARSYTFYFDEWDLIQTAPDWSPMTLLVPHNEHPSMLLLLVYALLLHTVGLRNYLPYMTVLLALHAANVMLLFELVRRRAGDLVGIAAAALLMVIGAGWEDLLWAFQLAWLGSIAFGLGALLALEAPRTRNRAITAAILVTGSLMFSGIGLVFAVAVAVLLLLTPERRKDLVWLAPVGAALIVWYLAFGRSGSSANPPPSISNVFVMPAYLVWGMGAAVGGLIGISGVAGLACLAPAAGALAFGWRRQRPDPLALGAAAGLIAFYLVTGATRAQLGYQQSGAGRYVYVGAVLWIILLAGVTRSLPWRGTWRPVLAACVFLAVFNSGVVLFEYATAKTQQMAREMADLQALSAVRLDPCLNPSGQVDLLVMPQVIEFYYYRAVDLYGDPVAGLAVTDQADFNRARFRLLSRGCP